MRTKDAVLLAVLVFCTSSLIPTYLRAQQAESQSSEIQRLYDEDQKDRDFGANSTGSPDQRKRMSERDQVRRKRVRQLLDQDALRTGTDYRQAAFIFQHGSTPSDYLLAHCLAMVGVSRGDMESRWIAAATLDRYLRSIKQPQVFGTQYFKEGPSSPYTQEPYDHALFPESIRKAFCVPSVSQQKDMLAAYNANQRPHVPSVCP